MGVSWRVFVPFCIRYISYGPQLCHFSSNMVVRWHAGAILHQVWSSIGMFVPLCIKYVSYGRQLAGVCHFAPGMLVSWRVFVPFCITC